MAMRAPSLDTAQASALARAEALRSCRTESISILLGPAEVCRESGHTGGLIVQCMPCASGA